MLCVCVFYTVTLNQRQMSQLLNIQRDEGSTHTLLQDGVDGSQFHQFILFMSNNMLTGSILVKLVIT